VLQAVENDIKKREELLNYVFESRRVEEISKIGVNSIEERSSDTSSLQISAITTSAL